MTVQQIRSLQKPHPHEVLQGFYRGSKEPVRSPVAGLSTLWLSKGKILVPVYPPPLSCPGVFNNFPHPTS